MNTTHYNPYSLRWKHGQFTVDHPQTGLPVPVAEVLAPAVEPAVALPPAAQAALESNPLLTREQAAAFLGVATTTLADWATQQKGPPFLDYGRSATYALADLLQWLAEQPRRGCAPPPVAPLKEAPKKTRGRPRSVPLI